MPRPKALYILSPDSVRLAFGPAEQAEIATLVDVMTRPLDAQSIFAYPELLANVELIFSGWGGPRLDDAMLNVAPHLKAVFHAAGSLSSIVTESAWNRGIHVMSAYAANAIPVAEYCLSMILFSLKHGWHHATMTKNQRRHTRSSPVPGCYGSTVGLISMGMIARTLRNLLRSFEMKVIAYDPFMTAAEAEELNIELVSLDEVFKRSDVVSLHSPSLEETRGMITGHHINSMKYGATFINTARGEIVREMELTEVVSRRHDLQIILDVTHPEPPSPDCGLFDLPNVILTPHIAGSLDAECTRMGRYMVEELRRYLTNQPLKYEITREIASVSSHRPNSVTPAITVAAAAQNHGVKPNHK